MSNQVNVYDAVAAHQTEAQDWFYRDVVCQFQLWRDRFNVEFKLNLTPTVFRIGGARSGCYGHFRPNPNDFGLPREIAFNEIHLLDRITKGEFWKAIGTLLHELLHAWQFDHGRPSTRNHHNRQLRDKAGELGLIMSTQGYTEYRPESPFMDLLKAYGVQVPTMPSLSSVKLTRPGSKLKKWSCGCTNIRVAVADFQAKCLKCGAIFVRRF